MTEENTLPGSLVSAEPEQSAEAEPTPAIFYADSRASEIAIAETVRQLIAGGELTEAIVELNSVVGVTVANTIQELSEQPGGEHLRYSVLSFETGFDQPTDDPEREALYQYAHQVISAQAGELPSRAVRVVLVPAILGSGQQRIDYFLDPENALPDLSPTTMPGHIAAQLQLGQDQPEVILIDPPERGLVQQVDGSYVRRLLGVNLSPSQDETEDETTD